MQREGKHPRRCPMPDDCRNCGHTLDSHQHYRAGDDCGARDCDCPRYRDPDRLRSGAAAYLFWVLLAGAVVAAGWPW